MDKHLFRKKQNHVPDTPENRERFLRVCNDENNYLGTDRYGKHWYTQELPSGKQVWVCTREGIIQNCGINEIPHSWNAGEGLCQPSSKGVKQDMEETTCRKAFMSMFYLLDSIYSRFPYNNLGVVLSDICPFTFKDSMSADPAAWQDYCEYYEEAKDGYSSELEAAYYTAIRFLRVYEEEWGYPIPYAMKEFTIEKYREYYYNVK